jgi:hypothetical protein
MGLNLDSGVLVFVHEGEREVPSPLVGEGQGEGKGASMSLFTPSLILPHRGGGEKTHHLRASLEIVALNLAPIRRM